MKNPKLIALAGYPSAGKDEFARYVSNRYAIHPDHIFKYADSILDTISSLTGIPLYYLKEISMDSHRKETELLTLLIDSSEYTYRELAIKIGEGFRYIFYEDIWVNALLTKLEVMYNADYIYGYNFITDLRRPNEYDLTKSFCESKNIDFILVYIDNPIAKQKLLDKYGSEANFPESEQYHDFLRNKADLIISNDYDLYTYHQKIETILKYPYRFNLDIYEINRHC